MKAFNRMPTYTEPLAQREGARPNTTRGWYQFFGGVFQGQPTGLHVSITPGASPYSFVALAGGTLIVSGGTVSDIQFSRDGVTFFETGQTAGMFPVSLGDIVQITYSVVPTTTFIPR